MSDGSRYRRSAGMSSAVIGLAVIAVVLAAGLGYAVVNPPTSTGSNTSATTTQTITSMSLSTQLTTQTSTTTTTAVSTNTVAAPFDLIAAAKAEGGVITDYTIQAPETFNQYIAPQFAKTFPWAHLTPVFLDPAGTITRPTSEYQAGKVVADVLETGNLPRMIVDVNNGVCAKVDLSNYLMLQGYPSSAYAPGNGQYYTRWASVNVLFYNTNLVSPSQVPTSYSFLGDPAWKGKLALDRPSALGSTGVILTSQYPILGNASWTQFMKNIAANNIAFQNSGGTVETVVTTGQYAIGADTLNGVLNSINKGLPVKVLWLPQVYITPSTLCIIKGAPHPFGAMLYVEWLLSTQEQLVITLGNSSPSVNPVLAPAAFPPGTLPATTTLTDLAQQTDYYSNPTKWANIYMGIFGA